MNEKLCARCKKPIELNVYCSKCFELKSRLYRIGNFNADITELFDRGASTKDILREIEIQLLIRAYQLRKERECRGERDE